jgi:hypothetical protein
MGDVGTFKNYRFRSELVKMWSMQTARGFANNQVRAQLVRKKDEEIWLGRTR